MEEKNILGGYFFWKQMRTPEDEFDNKLAGCEKSNVKCLDALIRSVECKFMSDHNHSVISC